MAETNVTNHEENKNELPPIPKKVDINVEEKSENIPFWAENPNVLFQPTYILEFFPVEEMTYNQKLNAISRTILILAIVGFLISRNPSILLVTLVTLGAIVLLQRYQNQKESFANNTVKDYLNETGRVNYNVFDKSTPGNPFSNVLIPDYDYHPNKKPAPPSYNDNTAADILKQAKKAVVQANPDQPDIADKLFHDLGDELVFEQSMRPFLSNPATTIPNDQEAFSNFCYGSMVSCKEGNAFACARNLERYTNQ
jgi:hypothetical protein